MKTLKRKTALVLPSISIKSLKPGDSLIFQAHGEMVTTQQENEDGSPKLNAKGAPANITTLKIGMYSKNEKGETLGNVVIPAIAKTGFEEACKETKLQGRFFEMERGANGASGKANKWSVWELEDCGKIGGGCS